MPASSRSAQAMSTTSTPASVGCTGLMNCLSAPWTARSTSVAGSHITDRASSSLRTTVSRDNSIGQHGGALAQLTANSGYHQCRVRHAAGHGQPGYGRERRSGSAGLVLATGFGHQNSGVIGKRSNQILPCRLMLALTCHNDSPSIEYASATNPEIQTRS